VGKKGLVCVSCIILVLASVLTVSGAIMPSASFGGVASAGLPGDYPEDKYMVPTGKARDHVFIFALIGAFSKMRGLEVWDGASIQSESLSIYDVNGKLLFYEFSVVKGGKIVGTVKASASMVLGTSVYSMQPGIRSYNPDKTRDEALKIAKAKYPTQQVIETLLVCYSYPKIGIMVRLSDPKTKLETTIIVDAADYKLVPPGDDKYDGLGYWSLYSKIPDATRKQRIEDYRKLDNLIVSVIKEAKVDTEGRLDEPIFIIIAITPESKSLNNFNLHGQETNDYCAVATGQMILEYRGYVYTQAQIAPAMDHHPSGCTNEGQVQGYESLSGGALDATYDTTANWSEAKAEIDAGRPLKSGIYRHARACAGYSSWWPFLRSWIFIYDPWGQTDSAQALPHEGATYWENWDDITHTNWIYVR